MQFDKLFDRVRVTAVALKRHDNVFELAYVKVFSVCIATSKFQFSYLNFQSDSVVALVMVYCSVKHFSL